MKSQKKARRQAGFTLLEMLAVIVVRGIVATLVVRQVGGNVDKGKFGAGKPQMASLSMKIEN
ncbi:type II secretion system protein, partial [Pediococcus acidilactici]|uniref:type II secretion system protein n=1 Tax=Pediococcus acidilactici TaxID=1254 RepID=UPI00300D7101